MSLSLTVGGTPDGLHATAYLDEADPPTEVATEAVISWRSDNTEVAQVADLGSTGGVGACTVTGVGVGTCSVMATATNADGTTAESSPEAVTVAAVAPPPPPPPPPSTNAVKVVITEDTPPAAAATTEPADTTAANPTPA